MHVYYAVVKAGHLQCHLRTSETHVISEGSTWEGLTENDRCVVATKNQGLVLSPDTLWDGSKKFKFKIHGRSDSDFSGNKDDRRSISGSPVFVNNAPVLFRSNTQKTVTFL